MSDRKKLEQFLSALARAGGQFQLGTTPEWHADKTYRRCRVSMSAGDKAMAMPLGMARKIAGDLRPYGLVEIADGLLEMVALAEKMDQDKPTIERARAEYKAAGATVQ